MSSRGRPPPEGNKKFSFIATARTQIFLGFRLKSRVFLLCGIFVLKKSLFYLSHSLTNFGFWIRISPERLIDRLVGIMEERGKAEVYHEKQRLQFCLLHSLNNLFQVPFLALCLAPPFNFKPLFFHIHSLNAYKFTFFISFTHMPFFSLFWDSLFMNLWLVQNLIRLKLVQKNNTREKKKMYFLGWITESMAMCWINGVSITGWWTCFGQAQIFLNSCY